MNADLLRMTPAELATATIDTKTYLAVSHWQWVMRQADEAVVPRHAVRRGK